MTITVTTRDLGKSYGDTRALDAVDLELFAGEVHALMGENGSGKSTMVKLLSGVIRPSRGEILVDGQVVHFASPHEARERGIGTIFQDPALVPDLTVVQNLALGKERRAAPGILGRTSRREAQEWLDLIQADVDPEARVRTLSIAGKQLVAIAKALSDRSRLLIFDEPTAALGDTESEHLLTQIDQLRKQGLGVVYISHRIAEVQRISDRVTVLKDGRVTCAGAEGLGRDEIIRLMIGRDPDDLFPTLDTPRDRVVLRASGLRSRDGSLDVEAFDLHAGEVVGIAGLDGSGRDTLARLLGGVERPASGTLELDGEVLKRPDPARSVRRGLSYVPPDRRRQAVVDSFSIARSITQSALWRFVRGGLVRTREENRTARDLATRMGVKTKDVSANVLTLSGGNQQKVVLARAVAAQSKVLVCDEPTAGVDVGARSDIYDQFAELARKGLGIVLSSSDMLELIGMCHRIVVICEGQITEVVPGHEATEERLLAAQLP
ncbi:MAG: D-ribose transporter ATP-binding protein [Streptosporangiaceae bacterium]|nr:D-ribose transporter ATP-binding protein [Streptosporangiaceae bacterium]